MTTNIELEERAKELLRDWQNVCVQIIDLKKRSTG